MIRIVSTNEERSFYSPARSLTGKQTFRAKVYVGAPYRVKWELTPAAGQLGTVIFDRPQQLVTDVRARHPNLTRVRVSLIVGREVVSLDTATVSVPQFFHIVPTTDFARDLYHFGLQGRSTSTGSAQRRADAWAVAQVLDRVISVSYRNFESINVRFSTSDPSSAVGAANVSTIRLGGKTTMPDTLGNTRMDLDNRKGQGKARVFARELTRRGLYACTRAPIYERAILAMQSRPLEPTDVFGPHTALDPRQQLVHRAIDIFARLIASVMTHECGHMLGLTPNPTTHNRTRFGHLMDKSHTFVQMTGYSYDPRTGVLIAGRPRARSSPAARGPA